MRNNANASKLLGREPFVYNKTWEDETLVFADDDEDLRKSLEKARRLALKKQEEKGASSPQAIVLLAASNPSNETVDDPNSTAEESRENKVVFTEMEEFVWGLHIDEEARKPEGEDVFMYDDEEANVPVREKKVMVPDESMHEVAVGKGLSGALKLLQDRGTLKESIEWGGRNTNKKKSKLVGIIEDEGKEFHIERTDEFGRILTPKEAFQNISHKFHGKERGRRKQEKLMKRMKSSDTTSLSVERMREAQACMKTPYLVLSGHAKPGLSTFEESRGKLNNQARIFQKRLDPDFSVL